MPRPLIEAKNIEKSYGRQTVLDGLSFQIAEGQKIALIGRNGAGKSTLMRILTGDERQDAGTVEMFPWTRVGTVRQNEVLPADRSGIAYLEEQTGKPSWECRKVASRFGLHEADLDKPPANLSGGYQMRVKLSALFLSDPSLLLLDEPVNYLDLQTLLFLEQVLADYRGAFVLVAHDRTFLQHTCEAVFEIERGELTTYDGPLDSFVEWKREQLEYRMKTNKRLAREIRHNQKFVDRFRYKASLATRAQNKLKHIGRLRAQITRIEADLSTVRIAIPSPSVHAGTAVRAEGLAIGYDGKAVASGISFEVMRGEKVVIVGDNGQGKSTLLKTLVGKIEPIDGYLRWWKHAKIGYYDQLTSASLYDAQTVLGHLTSCAPPDASSERILMMAGNFLFRDDDLDKTVSVLSGGERARLALAGILLQEHSVLVLDEPTNHLDVETAEGLALALAGYKGTVIFVSHARTFVSALAEKILEVQGGTVRRFMGSYDEYVADLAERAEAEAELETKESNSVEDRVRRREAHARVRELQRSAKRLEKQIDVLEAEKSELMQFFFENPTDYSPPRAQRLDEVKDELDGLERQWTKAQEEIESLRSS